MSLIAENFSRPRALALLGAFIALASLGACASQENRLGAKADTVPSAHTASASDLAEQRPADSGLDRERALEQLRAQRQAAQEVRAHSAPPLEMSRPTPRRVVPPAAPGEYLRDPLASGGHAPELVVLPAGSFGQGELTENDAEPIAGTPRRQVSVPAFALGRFEVTRGEFRRFVESEGFVTDAERNVPVADQDRPLPSCPELYDDEGKNGVADAHWRSPGFEQEDSHPVVCVTWQDAQAYVAWLSRETGQRYRLPTESELEYAIRAGSTTLWPWGDWGYSACDQANHFDLKAGEVYPDLLTYQDCDDGYAHTAPVGRFKPNLFGLHDAVGNVEEWAEDCWAPAHSDAPIDGSAWVSGSCVWRVLRGGGWASPSTQVRSAARMGREPEWRAPWAGFRVARDL